MARPSRDSRQHSRIRSSLHSEAVSADEKAPLYELNEHDAFQAVTLFFDQFAERAGDDLFTLLGDIAGRPDGGTFDPAAWGDWIACVRQVKSQAS